MIVVFLFEPFN